MQLSGKLLRYKRLQQHDQFWEKLKVDPDVKAIVPRWTSRFRPPVCLVIGIMICEDVELSFDEIRSREREANGELPIALITLAAGVPNPVGDEIDPSGTVRSDRQIVKIFKGKINESHIFALELRKVTTEGWIEKDLSLWREGPHVELKRMAAVASGPHVEHKRIAAKLSDEKDEDNEQLQIEDFILSRLSAEEYGEIE